MIFQGNAVATFVKLFYGVIWEEDIIKKNFFAKSTKNK
jgi:hypothetical protein